MTVNVASNATAGVRTRATQDDCHTVSTVCDFYCALVGSSVALQLPSPQTSPVLPDDIYQGESNGFDAAHSLKVAQR